MKPHRHDGAAALRRVLLLWWMGLALALFAGAAVRAEPLVSLRSTTLAAPPAGAQQVIAANGRLLALDAAAGRAWLLDAAGAGWSAAAWSPPAATVAAVGGAAAFLLTGDAANGRVDAVQRIGDAGPEPLPALPRPLRAVQAAAGDGTLLLAGIDAAGTPALLRWSAAAGWTPLQPPPGGAAPLALAAQGPALYAALPGAAASRLWRWNAEQGWVERAAAPGLVQPGSARAIGQAHVAFVVRRDADAAPQWMSLHTITDAWAPLGALPAGAAAAAVTPWQQGLAWLAGGTLHGVQIESGRQLLSVLDWAVIAVYLLAMLGTGLYFYLREKKVSTADFFVGGRSIPFWAAGISLYATNTSSISYIAIPAKAFETNWTYMTNNLVAVCGLMFVAVWIVPLLRRLDLMSVFHYLELRFHPAIRTIASALCVLVQIGSRLSVVLFLPALAIATITGLPVVWSVLLMGGFTIAYTALGGMKAVIWTDVAQLVVMAGGAFFAIGFMVWNVPGGAAAFAADAMAADKTKLLDFSFDLTKATVWGFIFLVLFDVVLTFPKDQVLMQRVLSTPSDKEAGRSIWAFAAIMIPGGFVFYGIGTALWAYYRAHPERLDPTLPIDATFPLFIAAELPAGLTGLIIAGIFAAAMSTLSSIINSVATLISVDFYEKLVRQPDAQTSVRVAEWMSVVVGLIGIGAALVLARFDIRSMFDVSIELAGLLGGGFAGAYTLGMFTRRANSPGVAIGIATAIVLTTLCWTLNLVHPYFYLGISILICIVVGYLASLAFPPPTRPLTGLTIYRDR